MNRYFMACNGHKGKLKVLGARYHADIEYWMNGYYKYKNPFILTNDVASSVLNRMQKSGDTISFIRAYNKGRVLTKA